MQYKTVKQKAFGEFIEKRSRFIGYICPVNTIEETNAFITEVKQKHYDAKHNAFAYILREGGVKRYSDDGEPQGTAGIPILDVLIKSGVTDVCVVAVRYFGGILLGGGGLVRAYSHTAKIALDAGRIITRTLCDELKIRIDYTFFGKLSALISENGGIVDNTEFGDGVTLYFHLPGEFSGGLNKKILDLTKGKYVPQKTGENYVEYQI